MQLSEVVRSRFGAQMALVLAMAAGAVASGCMLIGLPLYGWAHQRLVRLHLQAVGVPTSAAVAGARATVLLAAAGLAAVLAGLVGAAALGEALGPEHPLASPVGALLGVLIFVDASAPLLALVPRVLDARGTGGLRGAIDASVHAPPLFSPLERAGLAVALAAPSTALLAWGDAGPWAAPVAVVVAVLVISLGTAELARRYAASAPAGTHPEDRGAPFTGWVAATLTAGGLALVPLALAAFVPAPMRLATDLELVAADDALARSLPAVLDGGPVELRGTPRGVLVTRLDGGGAGEVRTRGRGAVESVRIEALPQGSGRRVLVETDAGVEVFALDEGGVRLDDVPVARMQAWVGIQGGVLGLVATLAWTLATRRLPQWGGEDLDGADWASARVLLGISFACVLLLVGWIVTAFLAG